MGFSKYVLMWSCLSWLEVVRVIPSRCTGINVRRAQWSEAIPGGRILSDAECIMLLVVVVLVRTSSIRELDSPESA